MDDFSFKAIGTRWCVSSDGTALTEAVRGAVIRWLEKFEKQFSRFIESSEVNAFRSANAGIYEISDTFAVLLEEANRLRVLTDGLYDPAAGELLELAGYDTTYKMAPSDATEHFSLPTWSLKGTTLHLAGPTAFDFGGIGKGYAIDVVAAIMKKHGYQHFIVDGGGDMFVTTKRDESPWKVAIQYPGQPDTAAGVVHLQNQALAVSDSFRRRWGTWHHIVDPKQKRAVDHVIGAVAVASNAWHADCMTSALFLAPERRYAEAAHTYDASYLVFEEDGSCRVSKNWRGELF